MATIYVSVSTREFDVAPRNTHGRASVSRDFKTAKPGRVYNITSVFLCGQGRC